MGFYFFGPIAGESVFHDNHLCPVCLGLLSGVGIIFAAAGLAVLFFSILMLCIYLLLAARNYSRCTKTKAARASMAAIHGAHPRLHTRGEYQCPAFDVQFSVYTHVCVCACVVFVSACVQVSENPAAKQWSTVGHSMYTLWVFVTVSSHA
jgi:hypothetical protein